MFSADLESVRRSPGAYEAFQAVRLIERHFWSGPASPPEHNAEGGQYAGGQHSGGMALDGLLLHPNIVFRSPASLAFPTAEIASLAPLLDDQNSETRWLLEVSFFGLTGPQGVLPLHLSALLLGAGNTSRPALSELLDLMDHRMISFFLRAWERSRPIHCLERALRQSASATEDAFTSSFRALVGLDSRNSPPHLAISPNLPIFFAGLFSDTVRSAAGLQQILSQSLGLPIHVQEFVGEWIDIPLDKQSRLTCDSDESAQIEMICLGRAVWSLQDRFRIEVGPVDYPTFLRLTPGGDLYAAVVEIARLYAGCQFLIEIQPLLAPEAVPRCLLQPEAGLQLGINTWLSSEPPKEPVRDVVFSHRGADKTPEIQT